MEEGKASTSSFTITSVQASEANLSDLIVTIASRMNILDGWEGCDETQVMRTLCISVCYKPIRLSTPTG